MKKWMLYVFIKSVQSQLAPVEHSPLSPISPSERSAGNRSQRFSLAARVLRILHTSDEHWRSLHGNEVTGRSTF